MGKKLVDDYFAKKSSYEPCSKFERAVEVIAKVVSVVILERLSSLPRG